MWVHVEPDMTNVRPTTGYQDCQHINNITSWLTDAMATIGLNAPEYVSLSYIKLHQSLQGCVSSQTCK